MYHCLLELYKNNIFHSPWLMFVRDILNDCGLSYIWLSQGEGISDIWFKNVIHSILFDQFVAQWRSDMENSSKCDYYRNYKLKFEPEMYLSIVPKNVYKLILKIRTCNHNLPIEKGRYINIDRRLRLCTVCTQDKLGDEYHYISECSNPEIVAARNECLPVYYCERPTLGKFYALLYCRI